MHTIFAAFFDSPLRCWVPKSSILTWHRGDRDRQGGSPRARPLHCTTLRLTLAIIPNVDDSGAQFLLEGDCVRAIPWLLKPKIIFHSQTWLLTVFELLLATKIVPCTGQLCTLYLYIVFQIIMPAKCCTSPLVFHCTTNIRCCSNLGTLA